MVFLCIAGATIIWLFNSLNKTYSRVINCPVHYNFNPSGFVVVSPPPERIRLNVTAGGWILLRRTLLFPKHPVQIVLGNPSRYHYILGPGLIRVFSDQLTDLKVVAVETDTLFFDIQARKDKNLTGKINLNSIHPDDSYRLVGPVTLDPGQFKISGPEKLIDTLPDIFEIIIDRDHLDKPFSEDIPLEYPNSDLASFIPENVHVSFDVEKFVPGKIEIPLSPLNFPKDSSAYLSARAMAASYSVSESRSDSVKASEFLVTADYKKMNRNTGLVPLEVQRVPAAVTDFKPDTTLMKVIYARKKKTR